MAFHTHAVAQRTPTREEREARESRNFKIGLAVLALLTATWIAGSITWAHCQTPLAKHMGQGLLVGGLLGGVGFAVWVNTDREERLASIGVPATAVLFALGILGGVFWRHAGDISALKLAGQISVGVGLVGGVVSCIVLNRCGVYFNTDLKNIDSGLKFTCD
jgi:hypothetical protein